MQSGCRRTFKLRQPRKCLTIATSSTVLSKPWSDDSLILWSGRAAEAWKSLIQTCTRYIVYIIDTQNTENRSGSARQHAMTNSQCGDTTAKPSYHWNSPIIQNCHRSRIFHEYSQHPPCSVLDTARPQILHFHSDTQSIFSVHSEREIRCCNTIMNQDYFENLKPNSRFQT